MNQFKCWPLPDKNYMELKNNANIRKLSNEMIDFNYAFKVFFSPIRCSIFRFVHLIL